jgi:hypothetical protein
MLPNKEKNRFGCDLCASRVNRTVLVEVETTARICRSGARAIVQNFKCRMQMRGVYSQGLLSTVHKTSVNVVGTRLSRQ